MHVGTLSGIWVKFLWQALANILQHRSQKAGLEVRPGGFFHAQAMMGSLCEEFGQSALEVLNIVDAERSKNCGRRPTAEVQMPCC